MKLRNPYNVPKVVQERVRRSYLVAFVQKFPSSLRSVGRWTWFFRGATVGASVVIVFVSTAVYADRTNVGPESILYPLKRSQEVLSLNLTEQAERPARHLEFALRRLEEIKAIQPQDSQDQKQDQKVERLKDDLRTELEHSLKTVEPPPSLPALVTSLQNDTGRNGELPKIPSQDFSRYRKQLAFCQELAEFMIRRESAIANVIEDNPDLIRKFEKRCKPEELTHEVEAVIEGAREREDEAREKREELEQEKSGKESQEDKKSQSDDTRRNPKVESNSRNER